MDTKSVDLNLLLVFDAMYQHRSVTKAGESLGLSQPATSAALNRLRALFDDPLFVRSGNNMITTPRADAVSADVRLVMQTIETSILKPQVFNPWVSDRTFSILAPDIAEVIFLPRLLAALSASAPLARFRTFGLPREAAAHALESGAADVAIGYFPDLHRAGYFMQRLFRSTYVCLCRKDHPHIGEHLTLRQFTSLGHAVVTSEGREHAFEQFIRNKGIERRVLVEVSHFMSLLPIIEASDVVATIPRDLAQLLAGYGNLRYVEPPMKAPVIEVQLIWNNRFRKDPAHVWLRQSIFKLFNQADKTV